MARKTGKDARREITRPEEGGPALRPESLLSSGSTLLNLAMSGRTEGAFYAGKYYLFVGDSDSGKTFLTLTTFAEAARNPFYKDHRFIHDNVEDGSLMDMSKFFGRRTSERIEPPRGSRKNPRFSSTVEELYFNIDYAFKEGVPFIYVVDSMDSLDTEDDQEHFEYRRKVHEGEVKDTNKGTYGMAKAKQNKAGLRRAFAQIKDSDSIIIFISQTIDNVDRNKAKFFPKVRAGGNSMTFFAHGEMWTKSVGQIYGRAHGEDYKLGIRSEIAVRKNRQTGRKVDVQIPIYWSIGIDDLGSCVDYLVTTKHWKAGKGEQITAPEFDFSGDREELIKLIIAREGGQEKLRRLVGMKWRDVEKSLIPDRPMRYADE